MRLLSVFLSLSLCLQDPLHYPHGTKFLAPGPLGQCHPVPGDSELICFGEREEQRGVGCQWWAQPSALGRDAGFEVLAPLTCRSQGASKEL